MSSKVRIGDFLQDKGKAEFSDTDDLIDLLLHENFHLSVFKEIVKRSGDCKVITHDVIKVYK